jgi:chloramphenicol-sensitive protein RarD
MRGIIINKSRLSFLLAFLAAGIWGFLSIPLRSLSGYSIEEIVFYRILVSMLFLVFFQILFNRSRLKKEIEVFRVMPVIKTKNWILLCLASSLLLTANWYSFIFVINRVNIQSAAFAYMVCPLLTASIAFGVLREKISVLQKIALSIASLAIILLSFKYLNDVLWSFLVAIWYSIYLVIQKFSPPMDKGIFLCLQLILSSIFILPYFLWKQLPFPLDLHFWLIISLVAIFFTVLPLYLSLYSLETISSTTMGIILYFNPIVAFSVAILYFNEQVNLFKLCSYGLVLIAVILFNIKHFSFLLKTKPIA